MNAPFTRPTEADASNRAWRTLAQGLLFDVLAALSVALTVTISAGIEWTSTYWLALAAAVAKSAIVAVVSYLARLTVPPPTAPTTRGGVVA